MEPQALVITIVYGLCVLIGVVQAIRMRWWDANAIKLLIFAILYVLLLAFDTACLTSGSCNVWSWIRTVLYSIVPVIILFLFVMGLGSKSSKAEEPAKK